MTDASCGQLLEVAFDHKSAPVTQHSILVDNRVQQLSIGPLIHHLVLQISNIDCLKEHWGYPGLKKKPPSKINSPDNVIITAYIQVIIRLLNKNKDIFYVIEVLFGKYVLELANMPENLHLLKVKN